MPRNHTPKKTLELRGSKHAVYNRADDLVAPEGAPEPPDYLSGPALKFWGYYVPILNKMGTASPADRDNLGAMCIDLAVMAATARRISEALDTGDVNMLIENNPSGKKKHPLWGVFRDASNDFHAIGKRFGLDPVARAAIVQAAAQDDGKDSSQQTIARLLRVAN